MVTQLNASAHSVLGWVEHRLTTETPALKPIGFVRLMQDVFATSGQLFFSQLGQVSRDFALMQLIPQSTNLFAR